MNRIREYAGLDWGLPSIDNETRSFVRWNGTEINAKGKSATTEKSNHSLVTMMALTKEMAVVC